MQAAGSVLHQRERQQFERLLRRARVDRVADRLQVVEAFLTSEKHHTAAEWQQLLEKAGVGLDEVFVQETLDLLTQFGLASRRKFEDGATRYEHRHLGEHHDHLICTRCGSIQEFHHPQLEALQQEVVSQHGFHHLRHNLQIYGLCRNCLADRKPSLPLALAAPGERVRVDRFTGGEEMRVRLADLGITVGCELEVISCGLGPAVVALKGTRIALGHGLSGKIQVRLVQ